MRLSGLKKDGFAMKKMHKRGMREYGKLFLLILAAVVLVETVILLIQLNEYKEAGYVPCVMDMYVITSEYAGYLFYPFCGLLVVFSLRNDFTVQRVLRGKSHRRIWLKTVGKTGGVSITIAAVSTVYLGILGKLLKLPAFTWDSEDSLYCRGTGLLMEDVSYWKLIGWYFSAAVLLIWATAIIGVLTFWLFNSYAIGIVLTAAVWIFTWMNCNALALYTGFQYATLAVGYQPDMQLWYPLGVIGGCALLGLLLVKNRDFLGKVKEGI
jgi:hypothetical protein